MLVTLASSASMAPALCHTVCSRVSHDDPRHRADLKSAATGVNVSPWSSIVPLMPPKQQRLVHLPSLLEECKEPAQNSLTDTNCYSPTSPN